MGMSRSCVSWQHTQVGWGSLWICILHWFSAAWVSVIISHVIMWLASFDWQVTSPAAASSATPRSSPALETAHGGFAQPWHNLKRKFWNVQIIILFFFAAFYGTLRREPRRPSLQDIRATACRWPCPLTSSSSFRGHATSQPSCGTSGRPSADRPLEAMRVTSMLLGSESQRHCKEASLFFFYSDFWSLPPFSSSPAALQWSQARMTPPVSCTTSELTRSSSPTRTPPSCAGSPPWLHPCPAACY